MDSGEASIAIGELVTDIPDVLVVVIVSVTAGADAEPFSQVDQFLRTVRRSAG